MIIESGCAYGRVCKSHPRMRVLARLTGPVVLLNLIHFALHWEIPLSCSTAGREEREYCREKQGSIELDGH
jgi:hypothetical protein